MAECGVCGAEFDDERALVDHLTAEHEWESLSRIDRKRIETHAPTRSPEVSRASVFARRLSSSQAGQQLRRRKVLGGIAGAAVAGGTLYRSRNWLRRRLGLTDVAFRFATVSDGHFGHPDREYVEHHDRVFEQLANEELDAVIHVGDIVESDFEDRFSDSIEAIERVRDEYLDPLDVPYTVAHSNHDAATGTEWRELFDTDFDHTFEIGDVGFVVLDSADEGGEETAPDAAFLDAALEEFADKRHVFVVSHYWFTPGLTERMEQAGLSWVVSNEAAERMHSQGNVRAFIHGHNHGATHRNVTHLQFADTELPHVSTGVFGGWRNESTIYGYRLWEIDTSGRIHTEYIDLDGAVVAAETF